MARQLVFLLAALFLVGCPTPMPPPVPGPTTFDAPANSDIFYGKIFDCHAAIIASQREAAVSPVSTCLASSLNACLIDLVGTSYDIATVACVARDVGTDAIVAVNAGKATETEKKIAANAKVFIETENLGYR